MSTQEKFNYFDLPRDGSYLIPELKHAGLLEEFLIESKSAAYVLVPKAHWVLLLQKGLAEFEHAGMQFVSAAMTEQNQKWGYIGKVGSTIVFSDVYATDPDKRYGAHMPITFAQMDGEYMREVEYQRCPYYCVNRHSGRILSLLMPEFSELDFLHSLSIAQQEGKRIESISVSHSLWYKFYLWVVEKGELFYTANPNPESQLNGHHGFFKGIPVYTNAFLPEGIKNLDGAPSIFFEVK